MIKFEKVSKYANDEAIILPKRATEYSAGYDFCAAEDVIIMPYDFQITNILRESDNNPKDAYTIEEMTEITKKAHSRPTLISTGVKCALEPNTYLSLSVRSSTPLKTWLVMANGEGKIDADYYNNESNEGEIFFQLINLSPLPIQIHKGDKLGQGIIYHYLKTDDDNASGARTGGFGSTT